MAISTALRCFCNDDPAAGHTRPIFAVSVVDGDTIMTGSADGTAIVWRRDIEGYFAPQLQAQAAADGV